MLNTKKLLTKILDKITMKQVVNATYTTGTANTWAKTNLQFTIPESGVYRVRAPFLNTSVAAVAYSIPSATNINQANIVQENTTYGTVDCITFISQGTYSLWTKCGAASRQNSLEIVRII